ncbi:hypothetical protein FIV42_06040 [Persicimonas caeni]|uniref:Receptor L-domain domain-containing protein n=1 Tax=Persicimonas caeni TaxID=2292766 RepID=A0A4Y6PQK3_PERCE|nr:hypothetical protein [Persicimonas caeni]QDG50307.1 hypothetical protein FIV42_06040 [Persicimonas caeni]QED31528.1 hypothetical protein FRD00_06035 [Persicimonas caeni]
MTKLLTTAALSLMVAGVSACGQAGDDGPVPESATSTSGQTAGGGSNGQCQVIQGTVNIDNQGDLQRFADLDCFTVERHLFVQETDDITDLSALSGLRSTGGFIGIADNTALVSASLPNLQETGEGLVLEGNTALETIEFASLRHVSGYLHVFDNPALESASFPWLLGVGDDVIFAGVDAMTNLDLPRLSCVMGTFIYEHSDGLECLCLPNLVVVNGDFKVHFNGGLESLSAPVLTTVWGDVELERNPQLAHLDMACLETVQGDFIALHNFSLAQCTIDELVADIDTIGGDVVAGDNSQTCPEEPVTAADVGCDDCMTNICVPAEQPTPGDDDDDDTPDAGDDDDDDDAGMPDVGDDDDAGMPDVGDDDDDVGDGFQGCTPGYWKNHLNDWCGYSPGATLGSVFDLSIYTSLSGISLEAALSLSGGPSEVDAAGLLLHHAVAALLNACALDYPLTEAEIVSKVNAALASGERSDMLDLKDELDAINNQYPCPL